MPTQNYPQEFLDLLEPGNTLHIYYGDNNIYNKVIHIRAIVDDNQIVYKVWSPSKGWRYRVDDLFSMHWDWTHGILVK